MFEKKKTILSIFSSFLPQPQPRYFEFGRVHILFLGHSITKYIYCWILGLSTPTLTLLVLLTKPNSAKMLPGHPRSILHN